jgi:Rrf2 family protein
MRSDFVVALHVMGFLTAVKGKPLSSQVLAKTYGTNPVVVRRILVQLNDAGLVNSQKGVGGGSLLARDPAGISLRQVYEAVAGDAGIMPRYPFGDKKASKALSTYLNRILAEAEEELLARLMQISILEMDDNVRPAICRMLDEMEV